MEDLNNMFDKLNLSDKSRITETIRKNNNLDTLIQSFENLKMENNDSMEYKYTINKLLDIFHILNTKQKCHISNSISISKWLY